MAINYIPVILGRHPVLVSNPSCIAPGEHPYVGKDKRIGLVGSQGLRKQVVVVDAPFTARTVEPELDHLTITGSEVFELRIVIVVVCCVEFVRGLMPVPRRHVDAELQPMPPASVCYLLDNIALPILPRAAFDTVTCPLAREEAETVMVLGDHDEILRTLVLAS